MNLVSIVKILQNFHGLLDECVKKMQEENKADTLIVLSNMYNYIPTFLSQVTDNQKFISLLQTKAFIMQSYALVEQDKCDEMLSIIQKAIDTFLLVINQADNTNANVNTLNKIYIYLNEIKKTIQEKNKELYFVKYKNLVESITIEQENFKKIRT